MVVVVLVERCYHSCKKVYQRRYGRDRVGFQRLEMTSPDDDEERHLKEVDDALPDIDDDDDFNTQRPFSI